jgi:hypothetical protein
MMAMTMSSSMRVKAVGRGYRAKVDALRCEWFFRTAKYFDDVPGMFSEADTRTAGANQCEYFAVKKVLGDFSSRR